MPYNIETFYQLVKGYLKIFLHYPHCENTEAENERIQILCAKGGNPI